MASGPISLTRRTIDASPKTARREAARFLQENRTRFPSDYRVGSRSYPKEDRETEGSAPRERGGREEALDKLHGEGLA